MAESDSYPIRWSENDLTFREVIRRGLPAVVKVIEGFCSEKEEESYSTGDLIKLEKVETYQNVAVQFLNKEITIPIDSKVKVRVIQEGPLCSVDELMKTHHRFICIERALNVKKYVGGGSIDLEDGDILEIEGMIPDVGIICKFNECDVTLELEFKDRFRVFSEETEYGLHEIVELFILPQKVFLLNNELSDFHEVEADDISKVLCKRDVMEILGVQEIDVVVGHNIWMEDRISSTLCCDQTQVLLHLNKTAIQEMIVHLPINYINDHHDFFCNEKFTNDQMMSNTHNVTSNTPETKTIAENDYCPMYDLPIVHKSVLSTDNLKKPGQYVISDSNGDYEMMLPPAKYKHLLTVCEQNDIEEYDHPTKSLQDLRSNTTDVRRPKIHFPNFFTLPSVLQKKPKKTKGQCTITQNMNMKTESYISNRSQVPVAKTDVLSGLERSRNFFRKHIRKTKTNSEVMDLNCREICDDNDHTLPS